MTEQAPYPPPLAPPSGWAACPRRVRAVLGGKTIVDTIRARYVWEIPPYPAYYLPLEDVAAEFLVDEQHEQRLKHGVARRHGLRAGGEERPQSVRVYGADADAAVAGHVRIDFAAPDAWYEEDEQIHVHPRSPYARIDTLRSRRHVCVEVDGVLLAETDCPVILFESGLPPRYYFDRTAVRFDHLRPSDTQTACPYKGVTTEYWSAAIGGAVHQDVAWSYAFPLQQVAPIAGLIAFFDERVDTTIDGVRQPRPSTPFS